MDRIGLWGLLEERVFPVPSTETLFNMYRDVDAELDLPAAPAIRRANLRHYLDSLPPRPPVLVVGEAPGPRGCRFSGVPFTNEAQLCSGALPFGGRQSSSGRAPFRAPSSTSFWRVMLPHYPRFLVWNSVPFHPHRAGERLSIRAPSREEMRDHARLLGEMYDLLRPALVVALGRKAEETLAELGVPSVFVRHPSQAGVRDFSAGMRSIFDGAIERSLRSAGGSQATDCA